MMQTYSKVTLSILTLFSISQSLLCAPIPIGTNVTIASGFDAPLLNTGSAPMIAKGLSGILTASGSGLISADVNGIRDQFVLSTIAAFFNINAQLINVQLRFDTSINRWWALATSASGGGVVSSPLTFYLAISNNGIINNASQWTVYTFQQDLVNPPGNTGDGIPTNSEFAAFGIDQNALYIGVNLFAAPSTFVSGTAFVVQKSSVLNGGPIVVNAFRNLSTLSHIFAPVGVDNFDASPEFGYIIGTTVSSNAELILYRIINPGSTTPSISAPITIPVALFANPVNAPCLSQYGNLYPISIPDTRLFASHVRNHNLFTVHHIGVDQNGSSSGTPDRTGCRWTELDLTGGGIETATTVPTVVAEGTLYDNAASNPNFYYYPAIMTNAAGTMTICGSTSASNVAVNVFATHGSILPPPSDANLLASVQLLTTDNNSLGNPQNTTQSWGPFSYTCIDPVDNRTMWTTQMFASAFDVRGYQVTELKV